MIINVELVLRPEEAADTNNFKKRISRQLGIPEEEIYQAVLRRRSIDARSKQVKVRLSFEIGVLESLPENKEKIRDYKQVVNAEPIVIIGAGPAGLFAALRLIELGFQPVVIERGKDVRSRRRDLAQISRMGLVNPDSNYCFGEGGAGTYSDGKLYTRSDKRGNVKRILESFIHFGADAGIAIEAHPHIGTNKLPGIVSAMREQIISSGGQVLFETRLEDIIYNQEGISNVRVKQLSNGSEYTINTRSVILATGHSARDVFRMLHRRNILIEAKDFALGVRIEHPQELIDSIQYHCTTRSPYLPPASYSLSGQFEGRGVYSFCMCPGGIIAPAATAPGEVVVNGWSPSKRNNPFANSGMVVSVGAADFAPYSEYGPLAAMEFQSGVERACFAAGGGNLTAPAQRLTDFCEGKSSTDLPAVSYIPGVIPSQLKDVLPKAVHEALVKGLMVHGKKLKGYYTREAVLVATESRTSSPVRIPRNKENLMHVQVAGLFPCAEGAGYAGGIVSAAMDGERCAEMAVQWLKQK